MKQHTPLYYTDSTDTSALSSAPMDTSTPGVKKRLMFGLILLIVLLGVIGYGVFRYQQTKHVYAIVGREVISIEEFEQAKLAYTNYLRSIDDQDSLNRIDDYTTQRLVLFEALRQDALASGDTVSDTEYGSSLASTASFYLPREYTADKMKYDDPAQIRADVARQYFQEEYDWGETELRRYQMIPLLRSKLEDNIIAKYSLLRIHTRWEPRPTDMSEERAQQIARRVLDLQTQALLEQEESDEYILQRGHNNRGTDESPAPNYLIVDPIYDVAAADIDNRFPGMATDMYAQLENAGDYTTTLRSEADSSYNVFRLQSISDAPYPSWDAYRRGKQNDADFFNQGFDWRRILIPSGAIR